MTVPSKAKPKGTKKTAGFVRSRAAVIPGRTSPSDAHVPEADWIVQHEDGSWWTRGGNFLCSSVTPLGFANPEGDELHGVLAEVRNHRELRWVVLSHEMSHYEFANALRLAGAFVADQFPEGLSCKTLWAVWHRPFRRMRSSFTLTPTDGRWVLRARALNAEIDGSCLVLEEFERSRRKAYPNLFAAPKQRRRESRAATP